MPKILRITLSSFRGIPCELSFDFHRPKTDTGTSALILGDNGTGKSSIIDGIEFALQGTYRRSSVLRSSAHPSLLNLHTRADSAHVTVLLDDLSTVQRSILRDVDGVYHADVGAIPGFGIAPLVLRRTDILSFLDSPEEQRQLMFLDYFRFTSEQFGIPDASQLRARREHLLELKSKRKADLKQVATLAGVSLDSLPSSVPEINEFLSIHAFGKGAPASLRPDLSRLAARIAKYSANIRECKDEIAAASKIRSRPRDEMMADLSAFLRGASERLSEWFMEISAARSFIYGIEFSVGEKSQMSLSVNVHLTNGSCCSPHHVLSEANLDLLALLLFLAIAKEASARGQARVLVLDDVLQSVDSTFRVAFAEFIIREFSDWQLFVTCHDRLWFNQLREVLRRAGHPFIEKSLGRWRFESGPSVLDLSDDWDDRLNRMVQSGDIPGICSCSGLVLETVCDRLSVLMEVSVVRRREDKYTLADLWPGIIKRAKKRQSAAVFAEVDRWVHLRNLVGAHHNEWAQSLSLSDAQCFGEATLHLYRTVRCAECRTWVESSGKDQFVCRCGTTIL